MNVKTSLWSGAGSNRRPSAFQGERRSAHYASGRSECSRPAFPRGPDADHAACRILVSAASHAVQPPPPEPCAQVSSARPRCYGSLGRDESLAIWRPPAGSSLGAGRRRQMTPDAAMRGDRHSSSASELRIRPIPAIPSAWSLSCGPGCRGFESPRSPHGLPTELPVSYRQNCCGDRLEDGFGV